MTIRICGSMEFAKEMLELKKKLEALGHRAILPKNTEKYATGRMNIENKWEKIEGDLIRDFFEEIKSYDGILIVNNDKEGIPNYVGGNSLIEMAFALVLSKKIFLLNPVPKMSYTEEIEAMKPIVLDEDLTQVR